MKCCKAIFRRLPQFATIWCAGFSRIFWTFKNTSDVLDSFGLFSDSVTKSWKSMVLFFLRFDPIRMVFHLYENWHADLLHTAVAHSYSDRLKMLLKKAFSNDNPDLRAARLMFGRLVTGLLAADYLFWPTRPIKGIPLFVFLPFFFPRF
jgi:hypothetical protein